MKLGARIFKTGIAIVLALLLADAFQLPSPVFAGIAAIFAIQPTIYRSYLSIIEQIQGNLVGATIAIIFGMFLGNNILIIGIAAIIVIMINLKLNIEKTISLALVTVIVIMESPTDTFIQFALMRFSTIMLGIFSAFLVNLIFFPPKYETKLYYQTSYLTEEITKWIRINIRHASEHILLKDEIKKLKNDLSELEQLYKKYKEERDYFRKNSIGKLRKVVIYKQMISTTKCALEILTKQHRFENDIALLPENLHDEIQEHLDGLMNLHEQLMLKFIGKVKPATNIENEVEPFTKKDLLSLFSDKLNELHFENEASFFHIVQVVSIIIEYEERLDHLDQLITTFLKYHNKDQSIFLKNKINDNNI